MEAKGGEYGWTCLILAAYNGHFAICRLLIDKGAQLEAKDSNGGTPLQYASSNGHIEIVRLLCDRGADIEASDEDGWRPLHDAARECHISVMKELIEERNADVNARMNDGATAAGVFGRGSCSYTPAGIAARKSISALLEAHGAIIDYGEEEEDQEEEEEEGGGHDDDDNADEDHGDDDEDDDDDDDD